MILYVLFGDTVDEVTFAKLALNSSPPSSASSASLNPPVGVWG
jgi:hypothetical protein